MQSDNRTATTEGFAALFSNGKYGQILRIDNPPDSIAFELVDAHDATIYPSAEFPSLVRRLLPKMLASQSLTGYAWVRIARTTVTTVTTEPVPVLDIG